MNKTLCYLALIAALLAACAPGPSSGVAGTPVVLPYPLATPTAVEEGAFPPVATPSGGSPHPTPAPADLTSAQRAAVGALAQSSGVSADQIQLVTTEAVLWPNGCLGVQRLGVMCTQNAVPGFVILLAAGGQQYEFHTNQDGTEIVPAQGGQPAGAALAAVRRQLANNLHIDPAAIAIESDAEVEWPDSCLGVAQPGLMCAQIVTPGHLVLLQANSLQLEYHTNADGSEIQPATVLLTWKRGGGIAGFCDDMTFYLSGEVHASSCRGQKDAALIDVLTVTEQKQLSAWFAQYGMVSVDLSDPKAVSDRMTRLMTFGGTGSQSPDPAAQQMLYAWAQTVFQRLETGN